MSEKKIQKIKVGIVYQIYSPKLDLYYIGSTFSRLCLRKTQHKYHSKLISQNKFSYLTSYEILKENDAQYTTLNSYAGITKRQLLDEETKQIMFLKQKIGGKIVNKNNTGLTLNIKEYNKIRYQKLKNKINISM